MMNQWSQGAFYYYCFKTFKTQIFTIKLSNHPLKVSQIKQLPVGTILSFYYFGRTVHLRFCSSETKDCMNGQWGWWHDAKKEGWIPSRPGVAIATPAQPIIIFLYIQVQILYYICLIWKYNHIWCLNLMVKCALF